MVKSLGAKTPKAVISYQFLEKLMRLTNNPDFFAGLSMQTAQQVLKQSVHDFQCWLSTLKSYNRDSSRFTGRPKMPHYTKTERKTFTLTNQDCIIYREGGVCYLKFPLTKVRLRIQNLPEDAILKEVKVIPYYSDFKVSYTYETKDTVPAEGLYASAAIDFGVDNIVALVTNNGSSLLVKGGVAKAKNQWFNKRKASLTGILTKGHPTTKRPTSRQLDGLSKNRDLFFHDMWHQISSRVITFCLANKVSTLYIGKTRYWKQNANIGKRNNQIFVAMPFDSLRRMIAYKAERAGIRIVEQEESYTSKASFVDGDYIPTYGADDEKSSFSGKRISRGLYRTADNAIINADINAAANIVRKAEQNAFSKLKDYGFLKNYIVLKYTDLHTSIAVKGIAAV